MIKTSNAWNHVLSYFLLYLNCMYHVCSDIANSSFTDLLIEDGQHIISSTTKVARTDVCQTNHGAEKSLGSPASINIAILLKRKPFQKKKYDLSTFC